MNLLQNLGAQSTKKIILLCLILVFQLATPLLGQSLYSLDGTKWEGEYSCAQGRTMLHLKMLLVNEQLIAVFSFNFDNRDIGKYTLIGDYDETTQRLIFTPKAWIARPDNYMMVGMDGYITDGGSVYSGKIPHWSCGDFYLELERHVMNAVKQVE